MNGYVEYDRSGSGDPRENDCLGKIYYVSGSYKLGDHRVGREKLRDITDDPDNISVPIFAYIHGGLIVATTPFNDRWDSGQCGYIVCSKEKAKRHFCLGSEAKLDDYLERATKVLEYEVKEFSLWLQGDVYRYQIISAEVITVGEGAGILTDRVSVVASMIKEEIDYFEEKREHLGGDCPGWTQ